MRGQLQNKGQLQNISLETIESKIEFDCGWEWSWYTGSFVYQCDGVPVPTPGLPPQPEEEH